MIRYAFLLVATMAVVAVVTRSPGARRVLFAILALMFIYAILKLTGAIDAIAPDRIGVL